MKRLSPTPRLSRSRAFALLVVLLALGSATLLLAGTQAISLRQATAGRDAVARVRAHWAARAGLESTLARLEANLQAGDQDSAFADLDAAAQASSGTLPAASWTIAHAQQSEPREGPLDPHSRLNINTMTRDDLLSLDSMSEDVADSILDWIDEDDTPRNLGAESGYYSQLPSPYEPRNLPIRSLAELDLIAGVDPTLVRGEDWNLNNRLDPSEDDGDLSFPPDNADGLLDAGWSAIISAHSIEPTMSLDVPGEFRVDLASAQPEDIVSRIPTINLSQARVIADYAASQGTTLWDFISTPLTTMATQTGNNAALVRDLSDEQLRALLQESTIDEPQGQPVQGRINLNTVDRATLDYATQLPAALADSIITARDGRASGFTSLLDLLEVPGLSRARLARLARFVTIESGAYTITSTGRDNATGLEITLFAVVHRRSLPMAITERRTQ